MENDAASAGGGEHGRVLPEGKRKGEIFVKMRPAGVFSVGRLLYNSIR